MSVVNGYGGQISQDNGSNTVPSVSEWFINYKASNPSAIVSNSGGMPITLTGNTDWTGGYSYKGYDALLIPGTSYTFLGYNGVVGATGGNASGTVLGESFTITVPTEDGGIISGAATFGGNSALTFAAGAAPTVGTGSVIGVTTAIGCKANWQKVNAAGASEAAADIPDVRSWTLSVKRSLVPYNSSNTAGVTGRTVGPWGEITASIDFYQGAYAYLSTAATKLTPGAIGILKLYVTSTLFFQLSYMVVEGNDLRVQMESEANNSVQLPFKFTGYTLVNSAMTTGVINRPGAVQMWP